MERERVKNIFTDDVYSFLHTTNQVMLTAHDHDFFEIFLLISGSVSHTKNDTEETLTAGSIRLLRPEDSHTFSAPSADFKMLNIAVTKDIFESLLGYINLPLRQSSKLTESECESVYNEWKINAGVSKKLLLSIVMLLKDDAQGKARQVPHWLSVLHFDIKEKSYYTESVNELEAICNKSIAHISREFKKYYGISIIDYYTELRLGYAKKLLVSTDLSILDTALTAGYYSVSHFNHIFKKAFDLTPSQYRQKHARRV